MSRPPERSPAIAPSPGREGRAGAGLAGERMPVRLLVLLGTLAALGPASVDIHVPALPTLADDLRTSASVSQATVGIFLLGLGLGQLVAGPLSDGLGRRRPMVGALVVFVGASLVCAAAPSPALLLGARFVQGAAAAAGTVIGRAVIRDLYAGAAGAKYLSRLVLIYGLAPMLGPFVGGQLLRLGSWRWVFVVLAAAGAVVAIVSAWVLPETHPPERRTPLMVRATGATLAALLRAPRFRAYALTVGLATGAMVAYVAGAPFVLEDVHGVPPQVVGVLMGVNGFAMIAGSQANARLLRTCEPARLLAAGVAGQVACGAALLATAALDAGLWIVAPLMFLLMTSWGFVPPNAIALAMEDHPRIAGSASALLGAFQYGVAALVAPVVGLGEEGSALPMSLVILSLATLTAAALWTARRAAPDVLGEDRRLA
jgi:DHA1 family bicyclomycin/chloramphenicol resistance-like MFS transporter